MDLYSKLAKQGWLGTAPQVDADLADRKRPAPNYGENGYIGEALKRVAAKKKGQSSDE